MSSFFRDRMNRIQQRSKELLKENHDHCETCNVVAEEFQLWEGNPKDGYFFPVWLSRVVEGIMDDLKEEKVVDGIMDDLKEEKESSTESNP